MVPYMVRQRMIDLTSRHIYGFAHPEHMNSWLRTMAQIRQRPEVSHDHWLAGAIEGVRDLPQTWPTRWPVERK